MFPTIYYLYFLPPPGKDLYINKGIMSPFVLAYTINCKSANYSGQKEDSDRTLGQKVIGLKIRTVLGHLACPLQPTGFQLVGAIRTKGVLRLGVSPRGVSLFFDSLAPIAI